jgi:hypothetical protein
VSTDALTRCGTLVVLTRRAPKTASRWELPRRRGRIAVVRCEMVHLGEKLYRSLHRAMRLQRSFVCLGALLKKLKDHGGEEVHACWRWSRLDTTHANGAPMAATGGSNHGTRTLRLVKGLLIPQSLGESWSIVGRRRLQIDAFAAL